MLGALNAHHASERAVARANVKSRVAKGAAYRTAIGELEAALANNNNDLEATEVEAAIEMAAKDLVTAANKNVNTEGGSAFNEVTNSSFSPDPTVNADTEQAVGELAADIQSGNVDAEAESVESGGDDNGF